MTTFISYSRVNSDFALRLARDLKAAGLDVWFDQLDIPTGARWDDEIEKALDKSKTFLIILTPESIQSQNVKDEVGYAIDAGKHILPVVIKPCNVPFRLRRFQYVDFTNKPYDDSLAEIKHLLTNPTELPVVGDDEGDSVQAKKPEPPQKPIEDKKPVESKPRRKLAPGVVIGIIAMVCIVSIATIIGLFPLINSGPGPKTPEVTTPPISAISPVSPTNTSQSFNTPTSETGGTGSNSVEMVLVPAGTFTMGNGNDDINEKPVHNVNLAAYTIDKFEVTNTSYAECVHAGKCTPPLDTRSSTRSTYYGDSQYDNYPVINITWDMAKKYCDWRGARLPSEAEWEKAAHGAEAQVYPWGNSIDCNKANYKGCGGNDTSEAGKYKDGQSPYGAFDMAGNVWEWVADWYQENYYTTLGDNVLDPRGPVAGDARVIRGGSYTNTDKSVRTTIRNFSNPNKNYLYVGFRCAGDVKP